MRRIHKYIYVLLLSYISISMSLVHAQSNMLYNPGADENGRYWVANGDVVIEEIDGNPCFVIYNGGYIMQDISLSENPEGRYVFITGVVSSERINDGGQIAGLPYLYGYMIGEEMIEDTSSSLILNYLQSPNMLYTSSDQNDWVVIGDIFEIPEYTKDIRIILAQATQRGWPHNGSAARFDELGVYIFASLEDATAFVDRMY